MTDENLTGQTPAQAPAGWYDDGSGRLRYWDGQLWTEHFAPAVPSPASAAPAYAAQPGAPRTRLVWPWVVGGVLLLALVVGGILAILAVVGITHSMSQASDAPEATVLDFDAAYKQGDCELLMASTTERLRSDYEIETCEQFSDSSADFLETLADYEVTVDSVRLSGGAAVVETTESYVLEGEPQASQERYDLVKDDGTWKIDQITEPE